MVYSNASNFHVMHLNQKRHQGKGRYMMQRYLARYIPDKIFDVYKKREGLSILPTMDVFKSQWTVGMFQSEFHMHYPINDSFKTYHSIKR